MEAGRTQFLLLFALLLLSTILQTEAAVETDGQECDGMGERFCNEAHRAEECPEPCKLKACMRNSPSEVQRAGAKRPPWLDALDWEELALSGLYEYVYTDEDYMCLSSCWKEPWDATCVMWEPFWGSKYCKRLACEHDSYNRYSGCHKDSEGNRKKPWHKPTCTECARVFPAGCGSELKEFLQPEMSAYREQKRIAVTRDLESSARLYCYQHYFGPLTTTSSTVSPGSQAGVPNISNERRDSLQTLEKEGRLLCPQPQCLTKDLGLLQKLALPWYLRSSQGSCSWNGCYGEATILHPAEWCRASASSCIQCGSTWCPPADAPASWLPLTMQSFQDTIEDLTLSRKQKRQSQSKQDPEEQKAGHEIVVDRSMCDQSATVVSGLSHRDVEGLSWYLE